MKLEKHFFNAFFYPFLFGIVSSIIIVFSILFYYSTDYLDKKSAEDIYNIEKKNAFININSVNILLSNILLKVQVGLQEQITFYEDITSNITDENREDSKANGYVINLQYILNNNFINNFKNIDYLSFWFLDNKTLDLDDTKPEVKKSDLYQQIAVFSQLTQSLYSIHMSMEDILLNIYFLSEGTNVFIGYPFKYFYGSNTINDFYDYKHNPSWCTDKDGKLIMHYKFQCRDVFNNILRVKEGAFDLNIKDQSNRKIFVSPPYYQLNNKNSDKVFTMCIQFNDSITMKNAFMCADIKYNNLFDSLDNFNERLIGYFSIVSVGLNEAFYFPQISTMGISKTLGEYIFRWDKDYYLEEKLNFIGKIHKLLTSNYRKKLSKEEFIADPISIFNQIYIDDSNGENQYFYLNKNKYYFCLFPIILENYDHQYEHILSIIYIYDKKLYYTHMLKYQSASYSKLIFQLFLFCLFGSIVLYLLVLAFKLLAKFIVVPIKNVNYMLDGINVGGEYRLKFLENLHKKQEDNLEKLNKIYQIQQKNNYDKLKKRRISNLKITKERPNKISSKQLNKEIIKNKIIENKLNKDDKDIKDIKEEEIKSKANSVKQNKIIKKMNSLITKAYNEEEKLINVTSDLIDDDFGMSLELNGEIIEPNVNYDKQYDLDNKIIEKELNFYDFDDELLQYRAVEIDRLIQSLLNLKGALLLTSSDNEVNHIIDYSNSEYIFNNFKNKEGSRMCQSNIGNLQSQLLKYDKAIYHLALSLENVELKKLLSNTLSDEFDESDTLLHRIENNYNRDNKEKEINKLVKKQQNSKHQKNFSQKIIGILINSRYNKLIHIYFKFFSFIQKSDYNYEKLNGWFMHTSFHTINYYHKILIQYIYLCFISNDLVKIGESILDYIEFLIKFKLKTSKNLKHILYINNKDIPDIKEKQEKKKKYFDKIIKWFNLFDNYSKQINENSALGNYKDILDAYTHNLASNNNDFNSGNQSALLFQINLQRCDFLKGKFALICKDYHDALLYLINAVKKKRIVVDGLIKKRALKHISKISEKIRKAIIKKNYSNLRFNETVYGLSNLEIKNLYQSKANALVNNNLLEEKNLINEEEEEEKDVRFIDEIDSIIDVIKNDIEECNEKQLKDIIILVDCNSTNKIVLESFIDVTKTILKSYLTNNDRLGVFLLLKEYRIICPMSRKCEIDFLNFTKDLDMYSEKIMKSERLDYTENEIIEEKLEVNESESYKNNISSENAFNESKEIINNIEIDIEKLIKSLNYCINYLKMKEINTNEKYFIYFTSNIKKFIDYLSDIGEYENYKNLSYDSGDKKKINILKDKKINFLLVGKVDNEEKDNDIYKKILLENFGAKSEMIPFDNMKKIKTILSANNIINDNIIFPNEIYK